MMRFPPYALFRLEAVAGRIGYVRCPEESNGEYGWACLGDDSMKVFEKGRIICYQSKGKENEP
jgi:hypothetical protein